MPLLLAVAFLAGLLTILSPCILPILPIVLATGASGGARRPWGVACGLVVSFTFSTSLLASLVLATGFPPQVLRVVAIVAFLLMGLVMLVPPMRERVELGVSRLVSGVPRMKSREGRGFGGGVLIGLGTGVLCTPCAGPILAAVATLAATSRVSAAVVAIAAAYGAGIAIPLALMGAGARALVARLRRASRLVPALAGVLLVATSAALALGVDLQAQLWAAQATGWTGALQSIEQLPAVGAQLSRLRGDRLVAPSTAPRLDNYGPADELTGLTHWMNGAPLTMRSLRGDVVLVDFWTYSCVNCARELPHLEAWYERYAPDGFVVVGVHSPEFAFEHDPANVEKAVRAQHVTFPVALDNNLATWTAYKNQYWPELYLVDAAGTVRYIHAGEGDYGATEAAIRALLTEDGHAPAQAWTTVPDTTPQDVTITPETYLGADHLDALASPEQPIVGKPVSYSMPKRLSLGSVAFQGPWTLEQEDMRADAAGAALALRFHADRVYLVAAPETEGSLATVLLDGHPLDASAAGTDVRGGTVALDRPRLYSLVDLHGVPADHTLELRFEQLGVRAYSFTFG